MSDRLQPPPMRAARRCVLAVIGAATLWATGGPAAAVDAPEPAPARVEVASSLQDIPQPDLTRLEPAVRERLSAARAEFEAVRRRPETTPSVLGQAYGRLGQRYHAQHVYDSAAASYANAARLDPTSFRWPYLEGHAHEQAHQLAPAARAFERALALAPDSALAKLRLARVYLQSNQAERAEPLLHQAASGAGLGAAVSYELGKMALSRRQFGRAVELLRQALEQQPQAGRVHFPLAMAYRGLGDLDQARAQLAQQGDGEPAFPDLLVDQLDALATGPRAHVERALAAVQAGRFDVAAQEFAQATVLNPDDVSIRVRWARTLVLIGERETARTQLIEAHRRAPGDANANFYLGVLAEDEQADEQAAAYYRAALRAHPDWDAAHFLLANVLMRGDAPQAALAHYEAVLETSPHNRDARLLQALALLRTGAEHATVRDRLEDALAAYPEEPRFAHALARLLAASPDARVRDGARALDIAERLYQEFHSVENGELLAMAQAELGRYDQAIALQEELLARSAGAEARQRRAALEQNQRRYRNGQPSRTPWTDEDPIFRPPPTAGGAATGSAGNGSP